MIEKTIYRKQVRVPKSNHKVYLNLLTIVRKAIKMTQRVKEMIGIMNR